jgi:hypothetical protein
MSISPGPPPMTAGTVRGLSAPVAAPVGAGRLTLGRVQTWIFEATQDARPRPEAPANWGRFMVGRFDAEWARTSALAEGSRALLAHCGMSYRDILVVDLVTGEGAIFSPGGSAHADLRKRKIRVCPMFEPFLAWLYEQDLAHMDRLPQLVELPDAPFALARPRIGEGG